MSKLKQERLLSRLKNCYAFSEAFYAKLKNLTIIRFLL